MRKKKSGWLVYYKLLVKIDAAFHVIISRSAEAIGIGCFYLVLCKIFAAIIRQDYKFTSLSIYKCFC
jgi:hypothetical protein